MSAVSWYPPYLYRIAVSPILTMVSTQEPQGVGDPIDRGAESQGGLRFPSTGEDPLNEILQRALARFEAELAPPEQQPGSSREPSKILVGLIQEVGEETYKKAVAGRSENPLAQALFDRLDATLRAVIPLLSLEDTVNLFRSGYPMGTGDQSLTQLCIERARLESGRLGVIRLFSESQAGTEHPGWVDLLRAASTALSKIQPTVVSDYLTGLKHIFSHSSSWTKQAEKIVTETARDIPLENLVAIYNRVRSGEYFSKELKTGLLVTVLDRINSSTRGCVKEELRAIRECAELPEFNPKIVSNVLSIEKMVAAKRFGSVLTVRELRALVGECALTQSSPERAPRGAIEHGEAPPAQSGSVTIADSLAVLTGEKLRSYISTLVEKGLRDPSSSLCREFLHTLACAPIDKLLSVRAVFSSSDAIPETLRVAITRELRQRFSDVVPTLKAVELTDLYKVCVAEAASENELAIVRRALRTAFGVPEHSEAAEVQRLSAFGRIVWRYIFHDLPEDSALLTHVMRTHFHKIMRDIAGKLSVKSFREPVLGAAIQYGAELGLTESYRPDRAMLGLPLWRLIIFTALVKGRRDVHSAITTPLTEAICSRLTTVDVKKDDLFPQKWRASENASEVESLCRYIISKIKIDDLTFEQRNVLLVNAKLLERRGPQVVNFLFERVRESFRGEVARMNPAECKGFAPTELRHFVQALAAARYRSLALLKELSDECTLNQGAWSPDELAMLAEAFATLRAGTPDFWSMVASRLARDWDSFSEVSLVTTVCSLVVQAPELVPDRFDSYVWRCLQKPEAIRKAAQALIALGKYEPKEGDRNYKWLLKSHFVSPQYPHEIEFGNKLPALLNVSKERIYSGVVVAGFETDWIVDFGSCRWIVELDGPAHFLVGPDGDVPQGRDVFQDLVFKRCGYTVYHIPYWSGPLKEQALRELRKGIAKRSSETAVSNSRIKYLEPLIPSPCDG